MRISKIVKYFLNNQNSDPQIKEMCYQGLKTVVDFIEENPYNKSMEARPVLHHLKRYRPPKPVKRWEGQKPRLKMTVTPHCRVHFRVLEAYITKVLKIRGYDVRNATGARGAMIPEFAVTGILPPANNIEQQMYDIRCGFNTRNLGLILNILCLDGFIQPGIYVIDMTEEGNPIEEYRKVLNDNHDLLDPRCIKIKEENRGDKNFAKQVKALDEQIMQLKLEDEK